MNLEEPRIKGRDFLTPSALALFLSIVSVLGLLSFYLLSGRNAVIRDARISLLFNAILTAENFDGSLRIADNVLVNIPLSYDGNRDLDSEALAKAAHTIGNVDNVYLVDEAGAVRMSAYPRLEPTIRMDSSFRDYFGSGEGSDALVVNAPAEGGDSLALISPVSFRGEGYFLVALFRGFDIQGRIEPLSDGGRKTIALKDRMGSILVLGKSEADDEDPSEILEASASFSNYPVKVMVSTPMDAVLALWRTEYRIMLVAGVLFLFTILALVMYGVVLRKRGRQVAVLKETVEADVTLFKEINHRIKNNLSIVESVLSLGSGQLPDEASPASNVLKSAMNRIHSIVLIHQLLYKDPGEKDIRLREYISELIAAIGSLYDQEGTIATDIRIDEDVVLDFDRAVPCGMILSELLTNAYKYAFPSGRRGLISIHASRIDDGEVDLTVDDDGVGFVQNETTESTSGLGMMLVPELAAQIHASIERRPDKTPGTSWKLRFRPIS